MKSYWKEIEAMGWGKSSVNYEALSREFHAKWGKRKMKAVRRFVGQKVSELYKQVDQWEKKNNTRLDIGSDDGFGDVLHHIVGLGEDAFNKAIAIPKLIELRYNAKYGSKEGYTESFSYAFHEPEKKQSVLKKVKGYFDLNTPGIQMMMLQRIWDSFNKESKETLVEQLMKQYRSMPLPILADYYKEKFPL